MFTSTGAASIDPAAYAVIAVYPAMVDAALSQGVVGRARKAGRWRWHGISLLDMAGDAERIDERPAGGGPGMLLRPAVLDRALAVAAQWHNQPALRVVLTPDGAPLTQTLVESLSRERSLTFIAGRYEGFDDAWLGKAGALLISLGDFVLSGGELAAAALIDALIRIRPGVLGDAESAELDSHSTRLLDYPNYVSGADTTAAGSELLSAGNHGAITRWRREQALLRTLQRRPDLLAVAPLSPTDRALLISALRRWPSTRRPTL